MVKIDFEFDSPYGVFRDALHLQDDHGLSDDEIQAIQQQRFNNWIAIVTAPSEELPPVESPPEQGV
jgi:hypothetical protein